MVGRRGQLSTAWWKDGHRPTLHGRQPSTSITPANSSSHGANPSALHPDSPMIFQQSRGNVLSFSTSAQYYSDPELRKKQISQMDGWVCLTNTPAVFQAVADDAQRQAKQVCFCFFFFFTKARNMLITQTSADKSA